LIALKEIDKIESLNVSKNKITCKGGSLIGELISSYSKLRVLLMQFNQVMGKGG
jgi:Ran GTPase-activating protein (RanGAP) involved in mRNA processing and transport